MTEYKARKLLDKMNCCFHNSVIYVYFLHELSLMNYISSVQGSVIILALRHSITQLSLQEILTFTIGSPLLLAWAVIAYLAVRH